MHGMCRYSVKRGDVDFALAVNDWAALESLRGQLVSTGRLEVARGLPRRLRHCDGLPVDLLPFGARDVADCLQVLRSALPSQQRIHS